MIGLLSETNIYQESLVSFFVIATIVGFILMYVDKKRLKEHIARSNELINPHSTDVAEEKKSKKTKALKEFEYNGRIKDKTLIICAFFCCGLGEVIGMLIFKHKWYKNSFKIGMPTIALFNIAFFVLMYFAFMEMGSDGSIFWTA